jgi:PAS domain-containing protein
VLDVRAATPATGIPALALIGSDHRILRCTEGFWRHYDAGNGLNEYRAEIDRVLTGESDHLAVALDGHSAELEAVIDAHNTRSALLSLNLGAPADGVNALLADPLEDSPAIVYFKDLEGRYLRVNRRYTECLKTSQERLRGRTDAELPPGETVDGPRPGRGGEALEEPLALEYIVEGFEGRPALTVMRFAVRDRSGEPVATCGVAAPVTATDDVRSECARLMQIERWSRLDGATVRSEMLAQWGIVANGKGPPASGGTPVAQPRDEARDARIAALHDASATAARRAHELLAELDAERARGDQLEHALEQARKELAPVPAAPPPDDAERARLGAELEAAQDEVQHLREQLNVTQEQLTAAQHECARAKREPQSYRAGLGQRDGAGSPPLRWSPAAQRRLYAALRGASEWRVGLKDAVKILGAEGGWDAVTAWSPDAHGSLRCAAMWVADGRLGALETLTWQLGLPTAPVRAALDAPNATWVTDLASAENRHLRDAASHGIASALLVPLKDEGSTVALLEFLTRARTELEQELLTSVEGVALQLGQFAGLLRLGAPPRLRLGRL